MHAPDKAPTCNGDIVCHDLEVVPNCLYGSDWVEVTGIDLEAEQHHGHKDDGCVQIGAGEGCLEASDHRVHTDRQWNQPALHP